MDYTTVTETVNGFEQKVLTQFVADASRFSPASLAPQMILRFENIVGYDVGQGSNLYEIRVRYITMSNEEYLYLFDQVHGQLPGQYIL